jgi:predicted RNA-binding protein with TRAM domain
MFKSEESHSSMKNSGHAAPVTVGAEYDAKIEGISCLGDGKAKVEGFVVFVPGTQVGDQVRFRIDRITSRCAIGHKV